MAVTGAVLVLFVTFHCLMNSIAICWPAAYNSICEFLGANWYALIASAGLAVFIILHIIYAVWLTLQNRKARGNDRYSISKRPKNVEWSSQNMLVLGIVILAFLVVHLIQFWAKMQLQEIRGVHDVLPPAAGTLFLQEAFSQVYTPIVYIIGFVALWFHMNHGFWSMFQTCGWTNQVWIERLKKIGAWWVSIVVLLFIAQAIVFTVKAHDNYYKTDEVLRDQYKEMLIPMFEKDFGPDAAQAITAAPYDQMKQMVKGTLSQMEAPEAQSYFQNDPAFPARLETLRHAAALLDYLEVEEPEAPAMPEKSAPAQPNN
jgi:succinate dehydrogenase / fumarate reductase cytochrome b subunit